MSSYRVIFLQLCVLLQWVFLWNQINWYLSLQSIISIISCLYLSYWFITIFLYLIKKVYLGKFTSMIQRFWKRSFMLFWLIEIFLFSIYLFLICNNPEETLYMLDFNKLNKTFFISCIDFFYKLFIMLYCLIILYVSLILIKFSEKINFLILFVILYFLLYLEINQLFFFNTFFFNYVYIYDIEDKSWASEFDVLKNRIYYYYIYIFILLKYWHILYIYIYFILWYWYVYNFNMQSYNWISAFYQNYMFIYLFNLIYIYIFIKQVFKGSFVGEYYWFFLNNNTVNVIYDILYYFNFLYIYII